MITKLLSLIFSIICFTWFSFMTVNFHSELKINKMQVGSEERLNQLFDIFNPIFYTKGHYKSKPFSYLIAKEYESKKMFVQTDSFYYQTLLDYPYDYEILRDYALFQLRNNISISKADSLATSALNIKGFDYELNLLISEIEIYKGDYDKALAFLNKVFHNDYILEIELLANEIFLQKYVLADDIRKRNDSLKYTLSLIRIDSIRNHYLKNIKISKENIELRIVHETNEIGFKNYMRERYTNFCHFYTSVWTKGIEITIEQKRSLEKIILKYHTIKRRNSLLRISASKATSLTIDNIKVDFVSDLEGILNENQLSQFDPDNKFKRLG